jgi:hypothetical protein
MTVDFQQLQQQVRALGDDALLHEHEQRQRREQALSLLQDYAAQGERIRHKIERIVDQYDDTLRCAKPMQASSETLDAAVPVPVLPSQATIIAADGSQINPDRHAAENFGLVNVGAIQLQLHQPAAPQTLIRTELIYGDRLHTKRGGTLDEARVALLRDVRERRILADLADAAPVHPVITFTDGPLELWGAEASGQKADFDKSLEDYQAALARLRDLGAVTAGYVDSPSANLVLRMLEVAMLADDKLSEIRDSFPLQGATDLHLFGEILNPGERSAVFALQSISFKRYRGDLSLYFFYLHTGRGARPLARVEIPAWVAADSARVEALHAVLIQQCRVLGERAYPYLLHRAHEVAVVSLEEKEQTTQMIINELVRRGLPVGEKTQKQAIKDLPKKSRYTP